MGKLTITESELKCMVFEELDTMIEDGEIDEGALDYAREKARQLGRCVTQGIAGAQGMYSKVGSTASALKKRGVSAALGAVGEKDAAAAMSADAEETSAQGAQKAQMAKAATVLGKSDRTLRGAYEDLAANAQALGLIDQPAVKAALVKLQTAIGTVSQTITSMAAQE